jgi:hypothetical protein
MPTNPPLTASGSRELKRPRPIPRRVRDVITLMVYGRADDEDCKSIDFIEAAKLVGLHPDQMRRWLDRADVLALLRRERKACRAAINAGNPRALQRVRDKSKNDMAVVASVRQLEMSDQADLHGPAVTSPHMTIVIQQAPASPNPKIIDHEPAPPPPDPYRPSREFDDEGHPIFNPFKDR